MLLVASHLVNVAVAGVLPFLMLGGRATLDEVYGPDTPARRILAALYAAIALASLVAPVGHFALGRGEILIRVALVLFPVQIAYKVMTAPIVGWTHPVVISNLAIAALHAASLWRLTRGA